MSEKDYVLILWSSCIMAPLDRNMYSTPWGNTRLANMSIPEGRTSFIRHSKKKNNVFSLDANSLAICQSNQRQSCVTLSRWSCHSFQRDPPLDIILGVALRKQRCASFQRLSGHSKPKTATVWACCREIMKYMKYWIEKEIHEFESFSDAKALQDSKHLQGKHSVCRVIYQEYAYPGTGFLRNVASFKWMRWLCCSELFWDLTVCIWST